MPCRVLHHLVLAQPVAKMRDHVCNGFQMLVAEVQAGRDRYVDELGILRRRKDVIITRATEELRLLCETVEFPNPKAPEEVDFGHDLDGGAAHAVAAPLVASKAKAKAKASSATTAHADDGGKTASAGASASKHGSANNRGSGNDDNDDDSDDDDDRGSSSAAGSTASSSASTSGSGSDSGGETISDDSD